MAFWPSYFHKSDGDAASLKHLRTLQDNILRMGVVLGNERTENTVVHDVQALKAETQALRRRARPSRWLSGSGAPPRTSGAAGDFYLDTSELAVYNKVNATWMIVASLRGAAGPAGPVGPAGPTGPVGVAGENTSIIFHVIHQTYALGQMPTRYQMRATPQQRNSTYMVTVLGQVQRDEGESATANGRITLQVHGGAIILRHYLSRQATEYTFSAAGLHTFSDTGTEIIDIKVKSDSRTKRLVVGEVFVALSKVTVAQST